MNLSKFAASRWLLGLAQVMALMSLGFALLFLLNTTGGTLFLFSSLSPLLVLAASAVVAGVALAHFRRRHSLFEFETFEPGQIIFREGDVGDCAYFIQSGWVEVVRGSGETEAVLAKLNEGQCFGEMALLSNAPRNATVRAAGPAKLARLGKENFLRLLSAMPSAREDILKTAHERAQSEQRGQSAA